jgi:hypothetical protein
LMFSQGRGARKGKYGKLNVIPGLDFRFARPAALRDSFFDRLLFK